ncbi:DHH family phosphoesterase [Christensenellaceae bacterium OttesenSCG-928-K19]|nr:DHH family phosphoesterase [Christensenellaceae bacterium OttesenSCG-928-K19]
MDRKKLNYLSHDFVVAIALIAAAILVMLFVKVFYIRMVVIVVVFVVAALYFLLSAWLRQVRAYLADRILKKYAEKIDKYVNAASIPTAITKVNGKILWHNPAFFLLAGKQASGMNIFRLFEQMNKPEKDRKIKIAGKVYIREDIHASLDDAEYVIYRLVEAASARESVDLYKNVLPTICHIQIDNYGDLLRGTQQSKHAEIAAEIDKVISQNMKNIRAAYQKYDREKYFIVFERRYLSGLMQSKFSILEEVRKIDTGNNAIRPTLSMGVGVASTAAEANVNALKALEMALGRGGDQAVLKDEHEFKFYGGLQQGREKRTRVKSRMFAGALRNLMEQCDRVIIMGHSVPDLDCMGAALGLFACARRINKKTYIVMEKPNVAIQRVVEVMREDPDYKNVLVTPGEAEALMDEKTMLIIVDTQIADFTIAPQLIKEAEVTVVMDHHVRGTNHIEGATLFLHEPYASSTAEMVTEVVQYFSENIVLKPLEVEALMAGITIDTKGFSFKTGVRTFEAASYLRRMGADTTKIRHLFQDDFETYTARAKVVESAKVGEGGIAIAVCPRDIPTPQLLAAQAADALVGISGIRASFVLCEQEGYILVSGRSLGDVNVQRILEKMGGGGHATIAGAQLKGKGMDEVVQELKKKIQEYEKEV